MKFFAIYPWNVEYPYLRTFQMRIFKREKLFESNIYCERKIEVRNESNEALNLLCKYPFAEFSKEISQVPFTKTWLYLVLCIFPYLINI